MEPNKLPEYDGKLERGGWSRDARCSIYLLAHGTLSSAVQPYRCCPVVVVRWCACGIFGVGTAASHRRGAESLSRCLACRIPLWDPHQV